MFLLREYNKYDFEIESDDEKKFMIKGILQKADTLNQNGRIYPREILEKEIENYKLVVKEGQAWGELSHRDSPIIDLEKVSHIIREVSMKEDGVVYGLVQVANTPCGKIVKELVKLSGKVGISSRALGSLKKQGEHNIVQDDLHLICFDVVSEPSTISAYLSITEAKEIDVKVIEKILTSKQGNIGKTLNELLNILSRKKG